MPKFESEEAVLATQSNKSKTRPQLFHFTSVDSSVSLFRLQSGFH